MQLGEVAAGILHKVDARVGCLIYKAQLQPGHALRCLFRRGLRVCQWVCKRERSDCNGYDPIPHISLSVFDSFDVLQIRLTEAFHFFSCAVVST
jgi:hypothetical protein